MPRPLLVGAGTEKAGERLPYLISKLKAPRIAERLDQTADSARQQEWIYEQFLETTAGGRSLRPGCPGHHTRIRHTAFPANKSLEDFDFTVQPAAERPLISHLAQLAWVSGHANVCFFGPPGTGKTHLATALAIRACQAGHRVAFATAQQRIDRLEAAQNSNSLDRELRRLERCGLLVVDEIGYLPPKRLAADLLSR